MDLVDNSWNLTTIVAWWGAIVSTLTLLLGAAQWFFSSRQRLRVHVFAVATETRDRRASEADRILDALEGRGSATHGPRVRRYRLHTQSAGAAGVQARSPMPTVT